METYILWIIIPQQHGLYNYKIRAGLGRISKVKYTGSACHPSSGLTSERGLATQYKSRQPMMSWDSISTASLRKSATCHEKDISVGDSA